MKLCIKYSGSEQLSQTTHNIDSYCQLEYINDIWITNKYECTMDQEL